MDAIEAAAEGGGQGGREAFMYRHHPQTLKVKEMIESGMIGEPLLVKGAFSYNLSNPRNIRLDPAMGGGSLWDVGCYPLSYARFLLGAEPEEVFGWQNTAPSGIDDVFVAQVRFPGGAYAQFDCSFRLASRSFIEVVGSGGSIYIPEPYKPGKNVTGAPSAAPTAAVRWYHAWL